MSSTAVIWIVVVVAALLAVALVVGLTLSRRRKISLEQDQEKQVPKGGGYQAGGGISLAPGGEGATTRPSDAPSHPVEERTEVDGQPGVGDDASVPRDAPRRDIVDVGLPDTEQEPASTGTAEPAPDTVRADDTATAAPGTTTPDTPAPDTAPAEPAEAPKTGEPTPAAPEPAAPEAEAPKTAAPEPEPETEVEEPEPASGRIERLRGRLSKSRSALGQGLLGLLGAGDLDEDSWEEIEDTLLVADLGASTTTEIVERLREELSARGVRTSDDARAALRDVLIETLSPEADRSVRALPHEVDGAKQPAVVLVAGVNGTGKTTTTGKLARVLVAQGRQVLLGAADTFRAAAADQLETWSQRVGAEVVRGKEGADPASVAFDSVKRGVDAGVDAVLVDTAGRLHTKTGLMDELGKVKRVVEKQAKVDEVLLVLDATTGQNGLAQARVFSEVVDVTGVVLTKLDGTAKGGIVFQVQRELGVPVKLVGLGEGPDDLAPFEPSAFVDALLG
ncbi:MULTISPECIES: signal recognition particle-docking protein FtsY [Prauserella salsuginis group]|uniref:Signal recognition particle receptor FtsY n=1 Tax=Prauserella salsuginis TaxID=387889 RepID=A0ABW6GC44_9PSEU|nr:MULTISPECIES: signal recognition particle-docking protein FtsY [Prauserella salsuginis group]MCR3719359.1 fused signal recognition particle receptor [Prauserella flava]MCR3735627.1 fused signal recognition particle receptor [Prauserella salsuginis]